MIGSVGLERSTTFSLSSPSIWDHNCLSFKFWMIKTVPECSGLRFVYLSNLNMFDLSSVIFCMYDIKISIKKELAMWLQIAFLCIKLNYTQWKMMTWDTMVYD